MTTQTANPKPVVVLLTDLTEAECEERDPGGVTEPGWYWQSPDVPASEDGVGPFPSAEAAMRDAEATIADSPAPKIGPMPVTPITPGMRAATAAFVDRIARGYRENGRLEDAAHAEKHARQIRNAE